MAALAFQNDLIRGEETSRLLDPNVREDLQALIKLLYENEEKFLDILCVFREMYITRINSRPYIICLFFRTSLSNGFSLGFFTCFPHISRASASPMMIIRRLVDVEVRDARVCSSRTVDINCTLICNN